MWLEMARDEAHGGEGWEFGRFLWSPSTTVDGRKWAYWELLKQVRTGDSVLHLRGKGKKAAFVGISVADSDGYETSRRPPEPGAWDHAATFYRVPLTGYTELPEPIPLQDAFAASRKALADFYTDNRRRGRNRKKLFFVIQGGRLQCQNGAYLSELSPDLLEILWKRLLELPADADKRSRRLVRTGEVIREVSVRSGQGNFSKEVKDNFQGKCCFPGCAISDERFLVGGHIARWADVPNLRGEISNGLCFCLMHDKAFEAGLFTLNQALEIVPNVKRLRGVVWARKHITPKAGERIRSSEILPSAEILSLHWERIDFYPDL